MRRMKILALTALVMITGSCALDFGSPPDPLDAPGAVDSTDPDSVSPDVGDDTLPTPGACDPVYEWVQNEGWIDFVNLVEPDFEVVGPPSDNYGIQEIAGETALVIQDESLDILVHEVHAQDPDRFTLRFYVPLGAVAMAWPWFDTLDKDNPEARAGVFVGLTAETAADQKIILGVAPFQEPLEVTTRVVDMADRWLEVDLQIFPDEGRVTALFRAFDEGDESPSEERTELLELFPVDLYGPLNSGSALFSAGQPEDSDWPGTGKGVAWKTAHQSTLTIRPYDEDQCPVCEWHKVWTNNKLEFDEAQCVCVEAATPDGALSSDPGVNYCPPEEADNEACEWSDENQATMAYECTLVDPDEVGGFEGCYSWSPKDDWEGCDPHVTDEAWGECVRRDCDHWLEGTEGNKVERVHCAFVATTEDPCTCLEPAPPEISEAFACDPGPNDVFKPATIDGKAYCGPCRDIGGDAGNGCGFAHLAPCAGNGVCLEATCNPAQGCVIEDYPNGEPCDDEDVETPYSHCQEGACVPAVAPACDPAPCTVDIAACGAQAHTFKAGDLNLVGAWMAPDGRAFVTGGYSLFTVDPTPPPSGNAVQGVDSPTDGPLSIELHAVTGNDLGELFLATKSGLFVSDISGPGEWSWAPATVYSGWYNDVWSGTGVEGAPVFAVGENALTARRYSGEAWLGWQSNFEHHWGLDAIFTSVHGSSEEHIKVVGQNGAGTSLLGSIMLIDGEWHTEDVSSYVLEALGFEEGAPYHFSGVWGADDHHFYVVTSGGHLVHYTPNSQEEFWSGSWSKIDLPDEDMGQSWSFMAISGRRVDGETHLVLVGEEGLVVEHVVDTDEWTVRVEPIAGWPQWNDVHMAPDGSYVAVGPPGAGGGESNDDNVFIWQETGACTTICPDGQEAPEADGCHIGNVEAGEGGCAAIYAPHGALCDDGTDETFGDQCVPNTDGTDHTLCQGAALPCVKVSDAFDPLISCVEEVVGDGPYCKLSYAEPGAECTDWSGATKDDKCVMVFDEGDITVCSGTPIECLYEPPAKEPCFSHWEPSDGSTYEPDEGESIEDCAIVHRPAGSGCDDGDDETSDDVCADDGSCHGSTPGELEALIAVACEPFGSGYLKCKGIAREWSGAQAFCQSQGMGLVVIENVLENDMTNASFNDGEEEDSSFWIGLQDLEEEGTFVWSDGVTWKDDGSTADVFSAFALGEPNDTTGNENCVESGASWAADQSTEGFMKGWNDLPCSALESFVCEAPAACGDGKLSDHLEECDDGNNAHGDGCDQDCQLEVPGQDYCDAMAADCEWIESATYNSLNAGELPSDFCDLNTVDPCRKVNLNPEGGACWTTWQPEGFVCDQENPDNGCLGVDICDGSGGCQVVGQLDCDLQAGPCQYFVGCQNKDGLWGDVCTFEQMDEGAPCDDDDPSTSGEVCHATGSCAPPGPCVGDGCIAAGGIHTCALDPAGEAICWGENNAGQSSPSEGPFTAIAAGAFHTCALDPAGEAICWGENGAGQSTAAEGPFTAIAAGEVHTCALNAAGEAVCWGLDSGNLLTAPDGPFTAIAAGEVHTCALNEAGEAICWGETNAGLSPPGGPFTAIAVGIHTCALNEAGEAICWGSDFQGQSSPSEGPFTAIAAGILHTCALDAAGEGHCWGWNEYGQSTVPEGPFTAIAAGYHHTCALNAAGEALCWGSDNEGQSTVPDDFPCDLEVDPDCANGIVDGDTCENAIPVELSAGNDCPGATWCASVSGSTAGAAADYPSLCSGQGPELVYTFEIPASGTLAFSSQSDTTVSWQMSLGDVLVCDGPEAAIFCGEIDPGGKANLSVTPGTYWLHVGGLTAVDVISFSFTLSLKPQDAACKGITDGTACFFKSDNTFWWNAMDATALEGVCDNELCVYVEDSYWIPPWGAQDGQWGSNGVSFHVNNPNENGHASIKADLGFHPTFDVRVDLECNGAFINVNSDLPPSDPNFGVKGGIGVGWVGSIFQTWEAFDSNVSKIMSEQDLSARRYVRLLYDGHYLHAKTWKWNTSEPEAWDMTSVAEVPDWSEETGHTYVLIGNMTPAEDGAVNECKVYGFAMRNYANAAPWTPGPLTTAPVYLDDYHGLMWTNLGVAESSEAGTAAQAVDYCEQLNGDASVGGYDGWKVPTIDQLRTLVMGCPKTEYGGGCGVSVACEEDDCYSADTCAGCGPVTEPPPGQSAGAYWHEDLLGSPVHYWSSTKWPSDPSHQWYVDFATGELNQEDAGGQVAHARCVRWTTPYWPLCGDGVIDPGEICDDTNLIDGDGCSSTCGTVPECTTVGSGEVKSHLDMGMVGLWPGGQFGRSIVALGDMDSDGTTDLAVGAPWDDQAGTKAGSVWILLMKPDGSVKSAVKITTGSGGFTGTLAEGDEFGTALANLGDVDGDGDLELAVGAPYTDADTGLDMGAVWILDLSPEGLVESHVKLVPGANGVPALAPGDGFGSALTTAQNVDDAGGPVLAVGLPEFGDKGVLMLLSLGASFESQFKDPMPNVFIEGGGQSGDRYGSSVADLGSFGGGGTVLAVGAEGSDIGGTDVGAVGLVYVTANGSPSAGPTFSQESGLSLGAGGGFGASVAALGDLNGDGFPDLAVGAPLSYGTGIIYTLFLNAAAEVAEIHHITDGEGGLPAFTLAANGQFGRSIANVGDRDGDGIIDLAVGANLYGAGAAWFLHMANACDP